MNLKLTAIVVALSAFTVRAQQKPSYTDAEAGKHVGEEATVTGKVFSVSTSGKGTTFLNFGAKFPNHTFGGVVFSKNSGAVGDMKAFEGKEVSLTGRIELSPDQKPQIIINSADQIKLAAEARPAPAVVSVPMPAATKPSAPAAEPYVSKPVLGKIELSSSWSSPRRDGEIIRKDLAKLFGEAGTASESLEADTSLSIYPGVAFLAPISVAVKTLNLETTKSVKARVNTPGLPQDSLNAHVFSGVFPGGYDRLYLITDVKDQVVSVMLVDSTSRTRVNNEPDTTGYHTYNFFSGAGKAASYLVVRHQVAPTDKSGGILAVDTLLVDPTDPENKTAGVVSKNTRSAGSAKQKTGKVVERSRWFVPASFASLILRCVGG